MIAARKRIRAKSQGYVLYDGPSMSDGSPIAVIATGFKRRSRNPKTGPVIQTYVIRTDVDPVTAMQTGLDRSVCNKCPFRISEARKRVAAGLPAGVRCYVTVGQSVQQVYKAYWAGNYPRISMAGATRLLAHYKVRGGTYGNLSNAPLWVTKLIAGSLGNLQFEHNWRLQRVQPWKQFAMASCGSEQEREEAKALGWRTFRVVNPGDPLMAGEVVCPATTRHKATCEKCMLCQGTMKQAKDVVVVSHGPGSELHREKIKRGRISLSLTN